MTSYDPVSLKILWDRLVAIADELVLSLVRTSFSMNVREGYDLSCMIFDARNVSRRCTRVTFDANLVR